MNWDPRRLSRAILALILVGGFVLLLTLKAVGFEGIGLELIAVIATPVGTVLGFYFKADKDE